MRRIILIFVSALFLISSSSLAAEHWVAETSSILTDLGDVYALSASNALAAGDGRQVLKTTTSGGTWSSKYSSLGGDFFALHFSSSLTGYAVGGTPADGPTSGFVFKTTDGGDNWSAATQPTNADILRDVFFISDTVGWVSSGNSIGDRLVYKTTDGGTTWTSTSTGLTSERTYYGLYFTDASTGWVVGTTGLIFKTTNGADLWVEQTSGTAVQLNDVFFINSTTGWVVGAGGTILKTTNGGTNWSAQTSNTANNLNAVIFLDASNGWAVGDSGTIMRTSDGGTNWAAETSGITTHLQGVHGTSSGNLYAAGDSGVILKRVIDPIPASAKHGRFTTFSQNGIYTTFTITGTNFNTAVAPTITFDSAKITSGAVISFSNTSIVLPVTFASDTPVSSPTVIHTMTVTNPGGGSGTLTFQVLADSAGPSYSSLKINGGDYTSGMSLPFSNTFTGNLEDITGLSIDPTDDLEFTLWITSGSNTFYKTFTGGDIYTRLTSTTGSFRVVPNHVINFSTGAEVALGTAVGVNTPFTLTLTAKDIDGNQGNSALTLKFAGQASGEKAISNVLQAPNKNPTPANPMTIQFESKENLGTKNLPIFSMVGPVANLTATILPGTNKVTWDGNTIAGQRAANGIYRIIFPGGASGKIVIYR